MKIIKRTKNGATHYVEKLSPHGVANGFTADKAKALAVSDEQLEKFGQFYKNLSPELVGKFIVERVGEPPRSVEAPIEKPKAVKVEEKAEEKKLEVQTPALPPVPAAPAG